ncbi:hypothetical protein fugu_017482 [Takifugu bimaculatus]|uniref:Uncharacterized protein n=1 Tax=Takifugu bimaculatus TaxID=433685 RepID=A0A4Z2BR54_9TELE|nr:hypothetical protein fugu_017482 [Takifugu bimaculatus]
MAAVDSFQLLYREISRSCSFYYETLALVGALYAAGTAVLLLRDCCTMVRVHFLPRMIPTKRLTQRFGDWAVINGVSEPVARAYAEELARNGVCIILVGPDPPALADIASSLMHSYGVEAVVARTDFPLDQAACKPIKEALRGKDIGFLVNCVGHPLSSQNLLETPEHHLLELVNNNIASATLMVRLVLPGMVERSRGAVVNISSSACCRPLPARVTLTASTGYLDQLSRALHFEYSDAGIFVQSLTPFQLALPEHQPSSSSCTRSGWFTPKPGGLRSPRHLHSGRLQQDHRLLAPHPAGHRPTCEHSTCVQHVCITSASLCFNFTVETHEMCSGMDLGVWLTDARRLVLNISITCL